MKKQIKKMAVIDLLRQKNEPQSLSELLTSLGTNYSERTVRRWLAQMTNEGVIVKLGEKRNTRYTLKPTFIERETESTSIIFSKRSAKVINQIRQPLFNRKPVAYHTEWLGQYQPNVTAYIPETMEIELFSMGNRAKNHEPAGTYAHHIYNRLLIDLSFNSSRLEGNTYSLIETKRLLIEGTHAKDKLDEEKIMILNHKEAIRYLVDNSEKLQINDIELCTLQFLLADGLVPTQYAGKLRDHGVRISGSTYIPLESPAQLTQQLNRICQKAALIQKPFERSFFLLVHVSYLQAFMDVNKRTARLSANIPLIQNNLVPLSFNDITREDYASAMISIYELNDIQPLLELYRFSYLRTCELYDATIESMGFDEVRVRYRQLRRTIIRFIIINKLNNKKLYSYIKEQAQAFVGKEHQEAFIEDVHEDLNMLNPARIAGLGVTVQQLTEWQTDYFVVRR